MIRSVTLIAIIAFVAVLFTAVTPSLAEEKKSADAVARELANPNASLAKLEFENQFYWYKGDLPDADDQSNYTLLFQPIFPFTLKPTASGGKANFFFRPAVPFLVDQPVPKVDDGEFDFGDEYLRRGIELMSKLVSKRYTRSMPIATWNNRLFYGYRALMYRLRPRINVKRLHDLELQRAGLGPAE